MRAFSSKRGHSLRRPKKRGQTGELDKFWPFFQAKYKFWKKKKKKNWQNVVKKGCLCEKMVESYWKKGSLGESKTKKGVNGRELVEKTGVSVSTPGLEKIGKTGSSLPGNLVIWREKIKKYIRETIPHWREMCPAGGKFCPACREINIFSTPGLHIPVNNFQWDTPPHPGYQQYIMKIHAEEKRIGKLTKIRQGIAWPIFCWNAPIISYRKVWSLYLTLIILWSVKGWQLHAFSP